VSSNEQRHALARSVCARIMALAEAGDEVEVLDAELLRLELGRQSYGPLDLRKDRRDWSREIDEEMADIAVYRALQRTSRRQAQKDSIEAGLEELKTDRSIKDELVRFDLSEGEG
jgi:hypothetical protein